MGKGLKGIINSKLFVIILILTLLCTTLLVGTYAWFTWSSADNTSLTMTIGKIADVIFSKGNEIDGGLAPVFNYTDGLSTSFTVNNRDTSGAVVEYNIKFNITSIDSKLINENVKYVLTKNDNIVSQGNLGSVNAGSSITLLSSTLDSGVTSYAFYLYIDGNVENDLDMIGKTIVGTITLDAKENNYTPYTDFTYVLGPSSSVTVPEYYGSSNPTAISIGSNEILLTKYNGSDVNVNVPSTYVIDDVTYNVVMVSYAYYNPGVAVEMFGGAFYYNDVVECVSLGNNIKLLYSYYEDDYEYEGYWYDTKYVNENSADYMFSGCSNLRGAILPNTVTSQVYTFDMAYNYDELAFEPGGYCYGVF